MEKAKGVKACKGGKPNRTHSGEWPLTRVMKCPTCGAGVVLIRTTSLWHSKRDSNHYFKGDERDEQKYKY